MADKRLKLKAALLPSEVEQLSHDTHLVGVEFGDGSFNLNMFGRRRSWRGSVAEAFREVEEQRSMGEKHIRVVVIARSKIEAIGVADG